MRYGLDDTHDTARGLAPEEAYVASDGTLRVPCYGCSRPTHGYVGYTLAEAVAMGCPEARA